MTNWSSSVVHAQDTAEGILFRARKRGIMLWSENGHLHCKAPKGVLSEDDVHYLKRHRDELVARLEMAIGADAYERDLIPRPNRESVPLTFSQLSHWTGCKLATRPYMRQLATATRLQGRLDLGALRESIAAVVNRHEALRTRIEVVDGTPQQKILESNELVLEIEQLPAGIDRFHDKAVEQWIVQHVAKLIDVTSDSLLEIRLLKEGDEQHVLLIAMQHLIADGVSQNIALREIMTAYHQAVNRLAIGLPTIQIQFPEYALWQRQRSWVVKRAEYWERRLAGCQRVRLPSSKSPGRQSRSGYGTASIRIPCEMRAALTALSRRQRTSLVISAFSAYVALLMRLCNVSDIVVRYTSDGRISRRLQNAIGYFAFPLYLRLTVSTHASLSDLISQAALEYSIAHDYTDFGYADAIAPEREFAKNGGFNWVSHGADVERSEGAATSHALTQSDIPFEHPLLETLEFDREPVLLLYDLRTEVVGGLHFPRAFFSDETMESFARNYLSLLKTFLIRPECRIRDIPIS